MDYIQLNDKYKDALDGIEKDIQNGVFEKDACILNGVSETTYFRWKKEIPEFRERMDKAVLNYKKKIIQTVNVNSVKSGKVALEVLRTRWPREWNIPKKVQLTDPEGELERLMRIITGKPEKGDLEDEDLSRLPDADKS
jgi:hypothetical protein